MVASLKTIGYNGFFFYSCCYTVFALSTRLVWHAKVDWLSVIFVTFDILEPPAFQKYKVLNRGSLLADLKIEFLISVFSVIDPHGMIWICCKRIQNSFTRVDEREIQQNRNNNVFFSSGIYQGVCMSTKYSMPTE